MLIYKNSLLKHYFVNDSYYLSVLNVYNTKYAAIRKLYRKMKPLYLTDEETSQLLDWESLVSLIESGFGEVSRDEVIQPSRTLVPVASKEGVLLTMPAFVQSKCALGCKVVTAYARNSEIGLPSIMATILFLDSDTGKVKVIMEGNELTKWRTAAATIVATKHLHKGKKQILAILGAGAEGRSHAIGMKHIFNFEEVRIWNRHPERAESLCKELGPWCIPFADNEECVKGADVIVTATNSEVPIVKKDWVKEGALISVVGVQSKCFYSELEEAMYLDKDSVLYIDSIKTAENELSGLFKQGVQATELGMVINKDAEVPSQAKILIFKSLGMAIEDILAAKLVYQTYVKALNNIAMFD